MRGAKGYRVVGIFALKPFAELCSAYLVMVILEDISGEVEGFGFIDDRLVVSEKARIRNRIIDKRDRLQQEERREKSRRIKERLFSLDDFLLSTTIHLFVSFGSEVETEEIIKESISRGKRIVVPITDYKNQRLILSQLLDYDKELVRGHWGLKEPRKEYIREVALEEADLMVIPGIAFDRRGNRIGYGKGYYDRLLSGIKGKIPLIALCYEIQVMREIPYLYYDIKIDKIVTEERLIVPL